VPPPDFCAWTRLVKGLPCHGSTGECDPRHARHRV